MDISELFKTSWMNDYSTVEAQHWKEVLRLTLNCLPEKHRYEFESWILEKEQQLFFLAGEGPRLQLLLEFRKSNGISE